MLRMCSTRRFFVLAALVAATTSCGDVVRESHSPVMLVVESLQGATGAGGKVGTYSAILLSDVISFATTPAPCSFALRNCPTIFNDFGQMTLHLVSKDASISPTTNNQVRITRYHVRYYRADGRNTEGVDVPYEFDGAVTGTVPPSGSVSLAFEIVRHSAKEESPLRQLAVNGNLINTIADVTLYGKDEVGNDISVTGSISINFGDFADQTS